MTQKEAAVSGRAVLGVGRLYTIRTEGHTQVYLYDAQPPHNNIPIKAPVEFTDKIVRLVIETVEE